MKWYDWTIFVLVTVGAVNWGLLTWFGFNLVEFLSFNKNWISTTLYTLVGASGLVGVWRLVKSLR